MTYTALLSAIEALPGKPKPGGGWRARCPVHNDRKPSLSVDKADDGKLLIHCMAGCATEDIVTALGSSMTDLFPEDQQQPARIIILPSADRRPATSGERRFEARDTAGNIVGHHCRRDDGQGNKTIWWDPKGVSSKTLAPYLSWDLKPGRVVVVEGERATLACRAAGIQAVGTYGASSEPTAAALEPLRGRSVVLWPDNDDAGSKHMESLATVLTDIAADLSMVTPPQGAPKGWDAADAAPTTIADLVATATVIDTDEPKVRFMSEYESVPIDWIWDGWLPKGAVTLFDGNPGEAKSTTIMNLIAGMTRGHAWPDGAPGPEPCSALIITREDDPSKVLRPRLEAADADLTRVAFLEEEFVMPQDEKKLRKVVAKYRSISLVFIDPLFSHVDGKVKTISDNDIRTAVMTPLSTLASDYEIAVLAMRHNSKDTSKSAIMRGSGSFGGLVGAARSVWSATSEPDDETGTMKLFGVVKSNYAKKPETLRYEVYSATPPGELWVGKTVSAIRWHGASNLSIEDVLSEEDHEGARSATELLITYLEERSGEAGAEESKAYLRAHGHGSASVKAAKKRAGVVSTKTGFGAGWTWRLPDLSAKGSKESEPTSSTSSRQNTEGVGSSIEPFSSTPSTSSTSSGDGYEGVEGVEEVEGVGGFTREATTSTGEWLRPCRHYDEHQSSHRRVRGGWICRVCDQEEA